jgi:hypothetical protein
LCTRTYSQKIGNGAIAVNVIAVLFCSKLLLVAGNTQIFPIAANEVPLEGSPGRLSLGVVLVIDHLT